MPFNEDESAVNNVGKKLVWGPWHIVGLPGIMINVLALAFLAVALFWSFWPPESLVTAANMNYNILVFGGVMLIAIVYYLAWGRQRYTGPVIEVYPAS